MNLIKNKFFLIPVILCLLLLLSSKDKSDKEFSSGEFTVVYNDSSYLITYDVSLLKYPEYKFEDGFAKFYYEKMKDAAIDDLLFQFKDIREQLNLNDWLLYLLVHKATDSILKFDNDINNKTMFNWFVLARMGHNVRLEYFKKELTLYVHSPDVVFGWPSARSKGGYYVDLSSFHNSIDYSKYAPLRMKYQPVKKGIPFNFSMDSMPRIFESSTKTEELSFEYNNIPITFKYQIDTGYTAFLHRYPEIGLMGHCKAPLSEIAHETLVKQIKNYTDSMKNEQDKVRFLLSFTRTAFELEDDLEKLGERRIFFAEETLDHHTSDYEDRCILFSRLIQDIVGIDVSILKFSKRYTAAVAFTDSINAKPFSHEGKTYFVCDPTDELLLGQIPAKYEMKTPKFVKH